MNSYIAVTIGDINGIGIHLLIKEFKNNKIKNFILFTNYKIFSKLKIINSNLINIINNDGKSLNYNKNKLNIYNYNTQNKYTNAFDSIKLAYKFTVNKNFIGIVTLPINKKEISSVKKDFIDHTTFFSKLEKNKNSNMLFTYKKKIFYSINNSH